MRTTLKKYNFLIISTADWDNPFWTNKQHMATVLSDQGHKVLYFESLGLREPSKSSSSDKKRIIRRLKKFFSGRKEVNTNLSVFSPLVVPKHESKLFSFLNNALLKIYIKVFKILYFQGKPIIVWTYNPLSLEFLKGENIVYHCVDDLTAAPGLPVERIKKCEDDLVKHSRLTFVTSPTLLQKLRNLGDEKVHYFPNVAEVSHFSNALLNLKKPDDLSALEGPILGFIGAISSYKLDFGLIKYLADELPEANIVLIGLVGEGQPGTSIEQISHSPNIHLLGPKSYGSLPAYLKYFDVALLPCVINEYTRSMFPMKFFEYLAAEKKVVSTNLPSIIDFKDCCYIANSKEDFLEGVKKALKNNLQEFCNYGLLKESVKENTWEARTEKMLKLIDENL